MPIKNSAKKALRQSHKRHAQNLVFKQAYKKALKTVDKALKAGEETKELIVLAQKALDKAAKKGVIKANTASRRFSRLMARVNAKKA